MDIISQSKAMTRCFDFLWSKGIEVNAVGDLEEVRDVISGAGKDYLTPMTSPQHNDLTRSNCLWLKAEHEGQIVMLGGATYHDLEGEGVDRFWPRQMRRAYGNTGFNSVSSTVASALGERLVYFGDLYSCGKSRRDHRNVRAFTAIGHLASFQKWRPDSTYAFVRDNDIIRGADRRYGFVDSDPIPYFWESPPHPRSSSEWCVYTPKSKLDAMIGRVIQAISEA